MQATYPEWLVLIEACKRLKPVLIVLDTQARITVGVQENDNTEMGIVVDRAEKLRATTGACVLLLQHLGLNGEHGRGASTVKAALQTELTAGKQKRRITLKVDKQKDDEAIFDLTFKLAPITNVDVDVDVDGLPLSSAVLELDTSRQPARRHRRAAPRVRTGRHPRGAVREVFNTGDPGGTKAEIRSVVVTERRLMSKSSFYRCWNELVGMGRLVKIERGRWSWNEPSAAAA